MRMVSEEMALRSFDNNIDKIYLLFSDDTEVALESRDEIIKHGKGYGAFGIASSDYHPKDYTITDYEMTAKEKLDVIDYFYNCYYDTDQDTNLFAPEFYHLTNDIVNDKIPVKLDYLVDYEEGLIELLPNTKYIYKEEN